VPQQEPPVLAAGDRLSDHASGLGGGVAGIGIDRAGFARETAWDRVTGARRGTGAGGAGSGRETARDRVTRIPGR
jgi:hypothetical protein